MKKTSWTTMFAACLLIGLTASGCTTIPDRQTVSARNFANMKSAKPRGDMEQINFVKLRMETPPNYLLGSGDVLGIYISGITGTTETPPPIHNINDDKFKPAQGYPYQVREDGTLSLPMLDSPINVDGMSLIAAEEAIRQAYTYETDILLEGSTITVSLIRPRTYSVVVIREDVVSNDMRSSSGMASGKGEVYMGGIARGAANSLELPAFKNDVLEALSQSGGLPGLNAKNEVIILRNQFVTDDLMTNKTAGYASSIADEYNEKGQLSDLNPAMGIVRIPLRIGPNDPVPNLTSEDVTLGNGDVVYIQSRDAEIFYTGGMIKGGVYPLPRDYDLDVVGAIATAGGSIGAAAGSSSGYGATSKAGTLLPPTRVLVIREVNGRQFAIKMRQGDLMRDPTERILIEPNDVVILEYTNFELIFNILFSTLTFRVDTLFD